MKLKTLLYLAALIVLAQGCTQPDLTVTKSKVCLNLYNQSNCVTDELKPTWLHLEKDSIRLTPLEDLVSKDLVSFQQFGEPIAIPEGNYRVGKEGKRIFLKNDSLVNIVSNGEMGILLLLDEDGQLFAAAAETDDCPRFRIGLDGGEITRNGQSMGETMIVTSTVSYVDADSTAVIEKIVENDIASRTIPNDTGTEIVIVDNFRLAEVDCCDGGYEDCCEGDGDDPMGIVAPPTVTIDPALSGIPSLGRGFTKSLELITKRLKQRGANIQALSINTRGDGWTIRESHDIQDVCIWEDCHKIIVVDCETGAIKCYDTTECAVMIRLNGDGTVSILTPSGCNLAKAVQAC